jgi:hypothetical protein
MTALCVPIGAVMIFLGVLNLNRAQRSRAWPHVLGRIVEAEVKVKKGEDSTLYEAVVKYRYAVRGSNHEGTRVSFGDVDGGNSFKKAAHGMVSRYPAGTEVRVYYDPAWPARSVLVPGTGWRVYSILNFGVLFFLMGIALTWWRLGRFLAT